MKFTKQTVSATEYGVFKHPEGLEGWRFYRIEYGGSNEDCINEQTIWLPPNVNIWDIVNMIRRAQGQKEVKFE
jgi:hypothetical protein